MCMIARSNQFVDAVAKEIEAFGGKVRRLGRLASARGRLTPDSRLAQSFVVLADASVPDSFNAGLDKALEKVSAEFPLQAVVYNAAARIESPFLKLDARRLETSYRLNQLAPWILCQRAAPIMVSQGFGSILVTGATASIRGNAGFTCFASTKAALRTFCQSLAKELGPNGIHVAHFIIDGGVANSRVRHVRKDIDWSKLGTSMDPDSIADEYWHTHMQHWSSWTFEWVARSLLAELALTDKLRQIGFEAVQREVLIQLLICCFN